VELLLVLVVVALAVLVISAPLRSSGRSAERESATAGERAELEAARDAKYAEIRDAEVDYRTGKLSEPDWRALDRQLRREAVEILHRLDETDPAA
jgi:type II secretory pathway pseudopilin PulG